MELVILRWWPCPVISSAYKRAALLFTSISATAVLFSIANSCSSQENIDYWLMVEIFYFLRLILDPKLLLLSSNMYLPFSWHDRWRLTIRVILYSSTLSQMNYLWKWKITILIDSQLAPRGENRQICSFVVSRTPPAAIYRVWEILSINYYQMLVPGKRQP